MVKPQFLGRTGTAMDDLLNDFLAETAEILAEAGGAIVAWEADPTDRAQLDAIFRFVHTIKGSSGFLALPRLGDGVKKVYDSELKPMEKLRRVKGVVAEAEEAGAGEAEREPAVV
jgi:chemotaxis protein histidine kinase CheA